MRPTLLFLGGGLIVVSLTVTSLSADAASVLRGIMHSWDRNTRAATPMMNGHTAFNEITVRDTLNAYIVDSARLATSVSGQSADARDIRQRFVTFGTDAQNALQNLGQPNALRAAFSRIGDDCQSCHDQYKD